MCRALGSSRTREKEPCDRVLSLPCGFHMVAELPGAATAKAMSRPEQEETGEVFEEAPPETVEEINVDVPPERREDGVRTPRKRQAEREVFIGTPERDPEPRSSRVRQVHSCSEGQGMPSMPSMPVGMRGSSSVPVGSPLINAPWISTQGGTTFG